MNEILPSQHPKFRGNWNDLDQFVRLAKSPIRSEGREIALRDWSKYKLGRQKDFVQRKIEERTGKAAPWKKSTLYLTAPAIDLCGATLEGLCVGYGDLRRGKFHEVANFFSALEGSRVG